MLRINLFFFFFSFLETKVINLESSISESCPDLGRTGNNNFGPDLLHSELKLDCAQGLFTKRLIYKTPSMGRGISSVWSLVRVLQVAFRFYFISC